MTENQPPSSGGATTDQPGRPYYESLRTTLRGSLTKKKQIDEQLATLEEQIYKLESNYLEDTSGAGNIVRGFDNWVKGVVIGTDNRRGDDRKGARTRVRDEDRIFSNSSMTWIRSQESPGDASAANTPSHAPTPSSGLPASLKALDHATPGSTTSKSGNKKKKAAEKDDEDEGKPAKRSKISYGRG